MKLLIRADASVAMGTGHVMRGLALAQACQDAGGTAIFALAQATAGIQARLAAESCELGAISCAGGSEDDSRQTIELARKRHADWIVLDGYQFAAEYQRALKSAGLKVLFVDDYGHAAHYSADLVLNQNAHADESLYPKRDPGTGLLLGPRYCLLRREFASWRGWKRNITPVARKILVTMGGSDPLNVTRTVIEGLGSMDHVEAIVVVGSSNPHWNELQRNLDRSSSVKLKQGVTNMPELMAWADVAISGAGTTCWEMCLLQLPMILIDVAENQQPIAQGLQRLGAAVHLGSAGDVTKESIAQQVSDLLSSQDKREKLSGVCGELVDARGTERVLAELSRA